MDNRKAASYDYKTVRVKRETEVLLSDAYSALGWEVVNTTIDGGTLTHVNVSFKRDRKVPQKTELLRLQSKVDSSIASIERLQTAKKNAGIPEAITVGTLGVITLGGGLSMVMVLGGMMYTLIGSAIGVAGIGIGLLGGLVHSKINKLKLAEIEPALESEFARLSDLCDEAVALGQ